MKLSFCMLFAVTAIARTSFGAEEKKDEKSEAKNRKLAAEESLIEQGKIGYGSYKILAVRANGKYCVVSIVNGSDSAHTAVSCPE